MFDLIIQNGQILDGSGGEAFSADIAVENGKIAAVGTNLGGAKRTIDAAGKTVTPGFIDIHRHADGAAFRPGYGKLELAQGLTTIVSGNCGLSAAPIDGPYRQAVLDYLAPITGELGPEVPTASMADYFAALKNPPIATKMLVGAGTVRAAVAGYACQRLDGEQIRKIQRLLVRSLEEGALGVSLGLGYAPECFYTTEELLQVLEPLRGQNIPVTVHMREEGDGVCGSVREMIEIAKKADVPVHISHLKAIGKRNWDKKIPEAIVLMDRAREEGLDITCDVYPYTAGSTQLIHILPHDFLAGGTEAVTERLRDPGQRAVLAERIRCGTDFDNIAGMVGWENILCSTLNQPENKPYEGMSIADIAAAQGEDPFTCACNLLVSERCAITMIDFIAAGSDIARILRLPYSAVISDSTYPTRGRPHPRVYGTFPKVIEQYVLRDKVLTLPQAVASMTSVPADALRLRGKGRIAPGMDADLCVFDPENLRSGADYVRPEVLSSGFDCVLVGGEVR